MGLGVQIANHQGRQVLVARLRMLSNEAEQVCSLQVCVLAVEGCFRKQQAPAKTDTTSALLSAWLMVCP